MSTLNPDDAYTAWTYLQKRVGHLVDEAYRFHTGAKPVRMEPSAGFGHKLKGKLPQEAGEAAADLVQLLEDWAYEHDDIKETLEAEVD